MGKQLPVSDTRAQASAGAGDTRDPLEIASGVFCLGPWGHTQTNVYVVRAGASWILVDAGWAGDATRIVGACRLLLGPDAAPTAILLTHVHPDHAGSARLLAEAWHCPVLVAPGEIPIANANFAAMNRDAGPLDRWVVLPAMRAIGERRRAEVLSKQSLAGLVSELGPSVLGGGHGQPLTGPDTAAAVHDLARRVVAAH